MFKGLTKDLAGTADICASVSDPSKLAAATYLLPQEQVLFAFQSAKEEFVFTNEALLTVTGENATTTRKLVERFDYRENAITDVQFETTGRIDRDCEIKFTIGGKEISIDIARKEENAVKVYYKALIALAREQQERARNWQFAKDGLGNAASAMKMKGLALGDASKPSSATGLVAQATDVLSWFETDHQRLNARCYKTAINKALGVA